MAAAATNTPTTSNYCDLILIFATTPTWVARQTKAFVRRRITVPMSQGHGVPGAPS